ncbi:MAG: hypothetical protein MJ187_03080, partial [Alphaproteobacteria bacterium]|nr:hypothetical protein [Alphaproteobacteria bacterium]
MSKVINQIFIIPMLGILLFVSMAFGVCPCGEKPNDCTWFSIDLNATATVYYCLTVKGNCSTTLSDPLRDSSLNGVDKCEYAASGQYIDKQIYAVRGGGESENNPIYPEKISTSGSTGGGTGNAGTGNDECSVENSKTNPAICLGKKPDNNTNCYSTGLLYQNSMCVCNLGNGVYYSGDGNIACSSNRTLNISETDKDNLIDKILKQKSGENGSYKICNTDEFGTIAAIGVVSRTPVTTDNICVCKTGYDVSSNAQGCSCRDSNNRHYVGGACKCDVNGAELDKNTSDGKCTCGKGFEKQEDLNGNMKCTECNTGYYKDTVSNDSCTACRAGTYNPNTGSTASSACLPCKAGEYSEAGANACKTCPKGYYCPGGKDKIKCTAGTYQDQTGQPSCKKASKGYYVSSEGASSQTACAGPSYTDQTGQTKCKGCPGWSEETGTSVAPAYKGSTLFDALAYYPEDGDHDTKGGCYAIIKVDTYKPEHSSFSNTSKAIWCYVDPDGKGGYTDTYGYNGNGTDSFGCRIDPSKFKCDAGYYSDAGGNTSTGAKYDKTAKRIYSHTLKNLWTGACVSVGDGYYSSASELERHACKDLALGSKNPTGGTYSSVSTRGAETDCQYQAPDKTITGCSSVTTNIAEYGGTAWADTTYTVSANKGYYSSNNNKYSATCTACSKGTYSDAIGATSSSTCTACPEGSYNSSTGQYECTVCETGKTTSSKGATASTDCIECSNASTYVNEWNAPGWAKGTTDNSGYVMYRCTIHSCKSFTNADKLSASGVASASITLSSNKCTHSVSCSPGYHTPKPGASDPYQKEASCTGCAAGYYCINGEEKACAENTYSEDTAAECLRCDTGTNSKYPKSDGTTGTKGKETTLANKIEKCYVELAPGKYVKVKGEKTGLVDCPAGYYCPGCKEADFEVTGDAGWKNYIDKDAKDVSDDTTRCKINTKMYYNKTSGGDFECPPGTYQNANSSDSDKHVKPSSCKKCKA